jgi:hypothetical protein
MLGVIMLYVVMLNVGMLNVVKLSVVMLIVVRRLYTFDHQLSGHKRSFSYSSNSLFNEKKFLFPRLFIPHIKLSKEKI